MPLLGGMAGSSLIIRDRTIVYNVKFFFNTARAEAFVAGLHVHHMVLPGCPMVDDDLHNTRLDGITDFLSSDLTLTVSHGK